MNLRRIFALVVFAFFLTTGPDAAAQSSGFVAGRAIDAETGQPLVGTNIVITGTQQGTSTGPDGHFALGPLEAGRYTLQARFVGFQQVTEQVQVAAGDTTRIQFALASRAIGLEAVEITAYRGTPQTYEQMQKAEIQEANPRDAGELIRKMAGADAVRRGPVGLDPVVRGLRETQVGVYIDGMRTFPAGPARMDSPLSHSGPSTMRSVEVIKGPYALTSGGSAMSAIRVQTNGLWEGPSGWTGQIRGGYDTNLDSYQTTATVGGEEGRFAYRLDGAWRGGSTYETGGGTEVPGDFLNREARGKVGYKLNEASRITVAGGYQQQDDVDYPGRLLNAEFFKSGRGQIRYEYASGEGLLRGVDAQVYAYQTLHTMNNEGKVTFESVDFPGPPLRVSVDADISTIGGRLATDLVPSSDLRLKVGGDVYSAYRDAERPFQVVMDGMPMTPPFYESDQIWPGVRITDAGVFAQATRLFGPIEASGTIRTDVVWARADESQVTDVYLDIAGATIGDLSDEEVNVSGALMLNAALSDAWSLAIGGGTAVRTADALERYADRFPSSKAQTSAEFIGDPTLEPERSWQADVELKARYSALAFAVSGFARRIDNYITLDNAPDVEPMLPLPIFADGPFRYTNGEATFYGGEATLTVALLRPLTLSLKGSYLWGQNETTDQPALGVSPLRGDLGLRYEPPEGRFFVEGALRAVAEQDRVATVLGETPTDGYVTLDLKGGMDIGYGVSLEGGISNLTDTDYVNHLNAKNPYTQQPIPELGRVFFVDLTLSF